MNQLDLNGQTYTFAAAWHELSEAQLKALMPALRRRGEGASRAFALKQLLHPDVVDLLQGADPAQIGEICNALDWLWEEPVITAADTVQVIVPWFRHNGRTWLMPQPNLDDVVGEEWAFAELAISNLVEEPHNEGEHLLDLLSVLARPRRSLWDRLRKPFTQYPRKAWNPNELSAQVARLQGVPEHILFDCLRYARHAQLLLRVRYPDSFPQSTEESDRVNWGWEGAFHSIGEGGALGNSEEIRMANIHDICFHMDMHAYEAKKRQEEYKRERDKARRSAQNHTA